MKNRLIFLFLTGIFLGFLGCSRELPPEPEKYVLQGELNVKELKSYLKKNFSYSNNNLLLKSKDVDHSANLSFGEIDWQANETYTLNGYNTIEVPYKTTKNIYSLYQLDPTIPKNNREDEESIVNFAYSNLVFFKNEENKVQQLIVSYIPDAHSIENIDYFKSSKRMKLNNLDKLFSGYIEVKDWNHKVLQILRIKEGQVIKRYNLNNQNSATERSGTIQNQGRKSHSPRAGAQSTYVNCRQVCTPKYATVCASMPEAIDGEEICTQKKVGETCEEVCEELPGYDPSLPLPGNGGGGGGGGNGGSGGGGSWPSNTILFDQPKVVIEDINDYLKCISASQPITITIYANQPTKNSRDTWSGSANDPDVGHTFISLTQNGVTRVLGFYPEYGVDPFFQPADNGKLINDSGHAFDVSISYVIPTSKTVSVLNTVKAAAIKIYNLNTYNCTNFALSVSQSAGISLPSTSGTWPGGGGRNPGDFGQDIRLLKHTAGITKNVAGGIASNKGNCN